MTRYPLLNNSDLIKRTTYECICMVGNNPNPRNELVYYDEFGYWCLSKNQSIVCVVDNSIMHELYKKRNERFIEVLQGGYYEDELYKSIFIDVLDKYSKEIEKENKQL